VRTHGLKHTDGHAPKHHRCGRGRWPSAVKSETKHVSYLVQNINEKIYVTQMEWVVVVV
jgi:hypothetical protein